MFQRRVLLQQQARYSCQHRSITTYIQDVFRTGSFSPTNPLVDAVLKPAEIEPSSTTYEPSAKTGITSPSIAPLPSLSGIQPYHIPDAAKTLVQQAKTDGPATTAESDNLKELLQRLDSNEGQRNSLQQISSLLWLLSPDPSQKAEWRRSLGFLSPLQETSDHDEIYQSLSSLIVQNEEKDATGNPEEDLTWATKTWMKSYEIRCGKHLATPEEREEYQMLASALHDVEVEFQEAPLSTIGMSTATQKQLLGNMYNFVGIRNRQAELLGYQNYAELMMDSHMASMEQVKELHGKVAEQVVPLVHVESSPLQNSMLDSYLSSPTPAGSKKKSSAKEQQQRSDRVSMLQLQEHVTLDGALFFLTRLSQDLFGVSIVEEEGASAAAWHSDVRLFHMMDETTNEHLGSFYLDPYERAGKTNRALTSPLFARGSTATAGVPVVALSLSIEPPAWDTESAPMTWDDVESLLHEMGHVYQYLLSRPAMGTLLGPEKMPFDFSEFLPKFMENWMTERSTIYTLIGASQGRGTLEDEASIDQSIDAAFRIRSREKALRLAQQTFFGALEMSLFSDFDIRGEETILQLQNRLASELVPHDLPDEKNIAPLLDVFRENASERRMGWYRYLWCDVLSANIFEQFKLAYSEDSSSMPELKESLRRVVLEPGALVNIDGIGDKFSLNDCSPNALFERHRLVKFSK